MKISAVLILAALALAGCKSNPERQSRYDAAKRNAPTCEADKECEVMWAAARRWIIDKSDTKLQHYSSDFMETFNDRNSAITGYRVTKEPLGQKYRIVLAAGCRNPFACVPDPVEMMEDFNRYVGRYRSAKPLTTKSYRHPADGRHKPEVLGKQSYQAAELSIGQNCSPQVELLKSENGEEVYSAPCASGRSLIIACQWRQCRLLD